MKIKKILTIFILSIFLTIIIYNISYKERNNILLLGDNNIQSLVKENYIYYLNQDNQINEVNNLFINDNKTYKDIMNDILNNKKIYYKKEYSYLNKYINNSDYILLSANNNEYASKCNKSIRVLKEYNNILFNDVSKIVNLINKMSNSQVIIIGNYCSVYNEEISDYLEKLYKDYKYINMYKLYNEYKNNNLEYQIYKEISVKMKKRT